MTQHRPLVLSERRVDGGLGWQSIVIAAVVLSLVGCKRPERPLTDIGEIAKQPARYEGQTVRVRGTVTSLYKLPLIGQWYVLKDNTGEIYVEPLGGLPPVDAQIHVRGVVESPLIIGGKTIGTRLKEVSRR